jgi:thymidylate synthase
MNSFIHEEHQYYKLIQDIIENGAWETGRNGKTKSIFGNMMKFSLSNQTIPILTSKKVAHKTCLKELLFFIKGKTDNNILKNQNVHIWDANSDSTFLEQRGLSHYKSGLIGPSYGYQWRHFNAPYSSTNGEPLAQGIDQLATIIQDLKDETKRTSRRLIMTAWNPLQLDEMVLPPCHLLCQFHVREGNKLSCALYQRSGDVGLGVPFNIASYCFLTHLLAKHCGLVAHEFVYFLGNAHIYDDHLEALEQQITRELYPFPSLTIKNIRDDISQYEVSDFIVEGYNSHESVHLCMRA